MPNDVQVSLRLPEDMVKRLERLEARLARAPNVAGVFRVSRQSVFRLALKRGLDVLEAEEKGDALSTAMPSAPVPQEEHSAPRASPSQEPTPVAAATPSALLPEAPEDPAVGAFKWSVGERDANVISGLMNRGEFIAGVSSYGGKTWDWWVRTGTGRRSKNIAGGTCGTRSLAAAAALQAVDTASAMKGKGG